MAGGLSPSNTGVPPAKEEKDGTIGGNTASTPKSKKGIEKAMAKSDSKKECANANAKPDSKAGKAKAKAKSIPVASTPSKAAPKMTAKVTPGKKAKPAKTARVVNRLPDGRPMGCSKCRWNTDLGCGQCLNPAFSGKRGSTDGSIV